MTPPAGGEGEVMQGYPDREVSHEYVRCSNDAPCTVASDLRARVRELEAAVENWRAIIADEQDENIKLFNLLGVMPEIEAGGAGTDAVVDAIQKLKAALATTQAALVAAAEEVVQAWDRMAKWAVRPTELLQVRLKDWRRAKDTVTRLRAALRTAEGRGSDVLPDHRAGQ